ncbi:MAG TPA: amidohydrolase family protein [Vicinamibacteria bacterium]|nr:amidohydrolase family protein [Vicinamibacteria bacterium]
MRTTPFLLLAMALAASLDAQTTALRAGRLIDPVMGTASMNQVILVEDETIAAVGDVAIPGGATVVDLSELSVLPGLVDTHNHLALTYKKEPESDVYYYTYISDSTPLRAIQAVSNGIQMLSSGFTVVRDMGNAGNYADTALRVAIEQGWVPGPTIINSGLIIGGMGGQYWPTPEMALDHGIVYPEYLDADTTDEIVKAVRQNVLFGAKVIKIMVDAKPYGYSVDEMKLFVREAARAGLKVEGHVQTREGARRAIEAGLWSLAHSRALDDELHRMMAEKGIWRAGTETPYTEYRGSQEAFDRTVAGLKNAYENGVKLTFSTDADYYVPGMTRGEVVINFLETWKAAGIPPAEIIKIMTINGYECAEIIDERGPIQPGLAADIIAVSGNPLEDIDALRDVRFVMRDGMIFKRDGVVTPEAFFHAGPVNGWQIR